MASSGTESDQWATSFAGIRDNLAGGWIGQMISAIYGSKPGSPRRSGPSANRKAAISPSRK